MNIASLLIVAVLAAGPKAPDDKTYWGGYAASVIAGKLVNVPASANIYEGKPKKKDDEVKQLVPPATVQDLPQTFVPEIPQARLPGSSFTTTPPVYLDQESIDRITKLLNEKAESPKPGPAPMPEPDKPNPVVKSEPPKAEEEKKPWEKPPYPLPPPPVPTDGRHLPPLPKVEVKAPPSAPTSYREVLAYARDQGKLVFIIFSTQSCIPCKKFKTETLKDENVRAELVKMNVGLIHGVDCDIEADIADFLKIHSVPVYIITDGKKLIRRGSGYLSPTDFIEWLKNGKKSDEEKSGT